MSSTDIAKKQASFLLRYALQSFAVILILAVLLRTFLISSYVMSGWSMLPSIWPGDFILAAKWSLHSLNRGDVVILRCPQSRDKICLKRVVGLAGDRIEFRDNLLVVNGTTATYQPIAEGAQVESVNGESWLIWPITKRGNAPDQAQTPVVVPPDQIYLLGDKRSEGEDSRTWGPVKDELLEARAMTVWLSLDWYEGEAVRSWPRIRWSRMLRSID